MSVTYRCSHCLRVLDVDPKGEIVPCPDHPHGHVTVEEGE
jgi:DNA-directed RNA polymerase subunit RPC12/RpoP